MEKRVQAAMSLGAGQPRSIARSYRNGLMPIRVLWYGDTMSMNSAMPAGSSGACDKAIGNDKAAKPQDVEHAIAPPRDGELDPGPSSLATDRA